jgi:hypothetical protein
MNPSEDVTDCSDDTIAAALGAVQELHDAALARFEEMHRDWYEISRQALGQSLPWPAAEDLPQAA